MHLQASHTYDKLLFEWILIVKSVLCMHLRYTIDNVEIDEVLNVVVFTNVKRIRANGELTKRQNSQSKKHLKFPLTLTAFEFNDKLTFDKHFFLIDVNFTCGIHIKCSTAYRKTREIRSTVNT